MNKKVLFVAVHPDDETLGCGGTMIKLSRAGYDLFWLILTEAKPGSGWSDQFIAERKLEIKQISSRFTIKETRILGFPTTHLDTIAMGELIKAISVVIQEIRPCMVFLPNHTDIHTDHKVGFEASFSACKNFRAPFIEKIYMYECLSETEFAAPFPQFAFTPNVFFDISPFIQEKIEAMKEYKSEIRESPFPRSEKIITSLAALRGSRIGVDYAEAFSLVFSSTI